MHGRALSLTESSIGNLNKMLDVTEVAVRAALRSSDPDLAEQHRRDIEALKRTRELITIHGESR